MHRRYATATPSCVLPALLLATSGMLTGCSDSPSEPPGPVPVGLAIEPSSATIDVGSSVTLVAEQILSDGTREIPAARNITWSSSNPNVATVVRGDVSEWGFVSGSGEGTVQITAVDMDGFSATGTVIVELPVVTVVVTNQLIAGVNISVNGSAVGSVPAGETRQTQVDPVSEMEVFWELIPPTLDGRALGDPMSGTFGPVQVTSDRVEIEIDNIVGEAYFFAPLIDNQTSSRLLMGVNMGLQAENRCNCVVAGGATNVFFGYYRLFSNSNVRAYRDGSGYTGSYIYWENFANSVETGPGTITLTATSAPVSGGNARMNVADPVPFTTWMGAVRDETRPGVIRDREPGER